MRKIILLTFLALFSLSRIALANELGVGVMLGYPTGLNGKYWLSGERAIDAGLAYSLGKNSDLNIHSDYLLHKKAALYFDEVHPLDLYYGIGGRMEFDDDIELGVRVPVGISHRFTEHPVDVFGELAPIVELVPKTGLELHLAIGARYYFN